MIILRLKYNQPLCAAQRVQFIFPPKELKALDTYPFFKGDLVRKSTPLRAYQNDKIGYNRNRHGFKKNRANWDKQKQKK